jgi:hypothetical protein
MNHAPHPIAMPARTPETEDRIQTALRRRIVAAGARRHEASMAPGSDTDALRTWRREADRGDRLRRALIDHLSGPVATA